MIIEEQDLDFVSTKFQEVEGWCWDQSAHLTLWLMSAQAELGYESTVLEIGVFKGKYLSVLYQKARRSPQTVLGIDTFQWSSRADVISTFTRIFGSVEGLNLVTEDSAKLTSTQVMAMLGGVPPSLISVDGDHSAQGVLSDLRLSKEIVGKGGIVAVDDFLNPKAIGVSEGCYRFFLESGDQSLRPFAYCANKLFCAERPFVDVYKEAIWGFVGQMPNLPLNQEFTRQLNLGRNYVDQDLLGAGVLIF